MICLTEFLNNGDLSDPFRSFISKSRYARWIEEYGRRETWEETVNRYVDYISAKADLTPDEKYHLRYNVLNHKVMPSMRLMMTAGEAAERSPISIYNCSYLSVDSLRAFDEALFVLMNGTGLGFGVPKEAVDKLPEVPELIVSSDETIVVHDSKEGWAQAYRELIASLFRGELPKWDLRQLRPEGARLRTFGGRSSGPEPLNELFEFTVVKVNAARGRKLKPIEVHDIMCKIGAVVVVGGVRRSALISLSDLEDGNMRHAKSGPWWEKNNQRALANNSAIYKRKPDRKKFDQEWTALVESKSGERGIFNLAGAKEHSPSRRKKGPLTGTNPCGEIILRSRGVCNLSEVIIEDTDTLDDLKSKVALAAKMGTWQASITNFTYLTEEWSKNAQEEALLGVSMTGAAGHKVLNGSEGAEKMGEWLEALKKIAVLTNRREAKRLGIAAAAAVTCNKPSGTVSTLTNTSSGLHDWYDEFFIRRVRVSKTDPIARFMEEAGLPSEVDFYNDKSLVFSFPFQAPEGAMTRNDRTAIEQLENWLIWKTKWTEHNPSVTINVKEEEWAEVGDWVFEHFDQIVGLSFLPHSDHTYEQAPFEAIDKDAYEALKATMPEAVDWTMLPLYELEDSTTSSQSLACTAGACDVSDLITAK